jgi:hypothetical protein
MLKFQSLRRVAISSLILLLILLSIDSSILPVRAAAAPEDQYTALLQMTWTETTPDSLIYLYFTGSGGEAKGVFYWESSSEIYWGLFFEGTYNGSQDGGVHGTISGYLFPKDLADKMCELDLEMRGTLIPECAGDRTAYYQEHIYTLIGTWSGQLFTDGRGDGIFAMEQIAAGKNGNEGLQEPVSGTWTVIEMNEGFLDPPAAPDVAILPILTNNPYPGGYAPAPTVTPEPAPEPGAVENPSSLESDTSQMDPIQIPAMAGAAVLGAVMGIGAAQVGSSVLAGRGFFGGRKAAQAAMAYSPATGKLIPADQAQQEHQLMNQGYVYRPDEGWVAPKGEYASREPSLATKQAEAARAQNKADLEQWKAESKKRIEDEELSDFRWNNAYKLRKSEALMRRQVAGYKLSAMAAEAALDIVMAVVIKKAPLKVAAEFQTVARFAASEVYQEVKIVTNNLTRAWRGQETSFWKDQAWHVATMPTRFVPSLNSPTTDMDMIVAQEAAKRSVGTSGRSSVDSLHRK